MDAIHSGPGLTVEAYAAFKGFDVPTLARWGVVTAANPYTGEPAVALPYLEAAGKLVRTKYRTAMTTVWDTQRGVPLIPYGLWWLPKIPANRLVILVEGESDCHAGWHHRILALGLPGCSAWRQEWAALLEDRPVYVWREPDQSGSRMVGLLAHDLVQAKVIQPCGVKDLAALHLAGGDGFETELQALIRAAVPIRNVTIPAPPSRRDIRVWRASVGRHDSLDDTAAVDRAHAVALDQLMRRLGFELKRRGHEWAMLCPFHDDARPSLRINPVKGTWYCDPCGAGGDAIEFLMRWRGLGFPDAVRAVAG